MRVDRILRRSLGVSETAPTDTTVKPAPEVDTEPLNLEDPLLDMEWPDYVPGSLRQPPPESEYKPENQVFWEVEEIDEEGNPVKKSDENIVIKPHDEL